MPQLRPIDTIGLIAIAVLAFAIVVIGVNVYDGPVVADQRLPSKQSPAIDPEKEAEAAKAEDVMAWRKGKEADRWTAASLEKRGRTQVLVFRCREKREHSKK